MQLLENIYEVITSPITLFEKLNDENNPPKLTLALITLIFVNIVFSTLTYNFSPTNLGTYLPELVLSCIGAVFLWYLFGAFFEFIAKIFNKSGKLKQIMCSFAYSTFPIVLFAPIQLIKPIGQTGYFLAVVFEIIIYFWSIYLMAKSIEITYNLTFSRAVMIIFLPLFSCFISILWLIEFISKMIYIFKI